MHDYRLTSYNRHTNKTTKQQYSKKTESFLSKERMRAGVITQSDLNEREAQISLLPIEIVYSEQDANVTRIVKFSDLQQQARQGVIIVAGYVMNQVVLG